MSLAEMEAEIDRLHRLMGAAYDLGDMREWERLRKEIARVGRQYRALPETEDGTE